MELSKELLLKMYNMMLRIRCFEQKAIELSRTDIFPGKLHSSLGQEAVAVGACFATKNGDFVVSTHRPIGHLLAMGANMGKMFAEFMGKATGYGGGKGGMMHIADLEHGILGTQGIVGSGIPIAAGAALSLKLAKKRNVILCFFGDGASNTGAFHEGINLAAIWKVPVVYICENNQYAVSTKVSSSLPIENVSQRAIGYGIPGSTVDGNDVVQIFQEVSKQVERARNGEGPSLIEAKTYRLQGHYEGDPLTYRPEKELTEALAKEPVHAFRERLLAENIYRSEELESMKALVMKEVEKAALYGIESPAAQIESITENVYA